MKIHKYLRILVFTIILVFPALTCFSQAITLPSLYVGTNRMSLDSKFNVLNPGWGGQLGFNMKVGCKWIQFDAGLEFNVKGLNKKYNQLMSFENGVELESKNSISSYALHTTLPVGLSLGYYKGDFEGYNVMGASLVGGGYIDLGIWGQNRLKQNNTLFNRNSNKYEESNVYTQNCFGDASIQRKRFDAGIYFGIAATTDIIGVSVIYRKGFLNMSNIDGYKFTNNGLFINLTLNCTKDDN